MLDFPFSPPPAPPQGVAGLIVSGDPSRAFDELLTKLVAKLISHHLDKRHKFHRALIDQLLSNFRATQKILVNVESRFLSIREQCNPEVGDVRPPAATEDVRSELYTRKRRRQ